MTVENIMSHMGIGTKLLTDRYAGEYLPPAQDQHVFYTYEPSSPSHTHVASSKHHHSGGGLKSNASMSALTLLAFLFFLHILQQCIKEHMNEMSNPPIVVMTAGKEGEDQLTKSNSKFDKMGTQYEPENEVKTDMYDDQTTDNKKIAENNMIKIDVFDPTVKKKVYGYISDSRMEKIEDNKRLSDSVNAMDKY